MKDKKIETEFDRFFKEHPEQKEIFDREYEAFSLSEFLLEKMEEEHISVRALAKKAGVSHTVIQKIRSQNAEKINFRTFYNVLYSLGYRINIEKM